MGMSSYVGEEAMRQLSNFEGEFEIIDKDEEALKDLVEQIKDSKFDSDSEPEEHSKKKKEKKAEKRVSKQCEKKFSDKTEKYKV